MIKRISCMPETIRTLQETINLRAYRGQFLISVLDDLEDKIENLYGEHGPKLRLEMMSDWKLTGEEKLAIFMNRSVVGYLFLRWRNDLFYSADFVREEEK